MALERKVLKDIIRARIARTIMYLQRFLKEMPKRLLPMRHKFEHPISGLHILVQQLSPTIKLGNPPSFSPPEGGIPDEINYFDLALNELKTALLYFKQRESDEVFKEIQDYYLEQKLSKIINDLEELKKELS